MSTHRILSKTDDAIVAYLIGLSVGTSANIFPARRASDKILPCVIVESKAWQAPEGQEFTANAVVDVEVTVKTNAAIDVGSDAATVEQTADDFIGATFDAFEAGNDGTSTALAVALNAAAVTAGVGWQAFGAIITGGSRTQDGDAWLDTVTLQIHCAPSDVDND